uniref:Zgc:113307 n=1 Tax=Neogobius melanostomus TaxID=47308 RepID=A0A8C6T2U2_9GOBI
MDMDYGGVPLWINHLLGEPSVMSLQGRSMDRSWFRATNQLSCPDQCECPIHWPTALYCDSRGLVNVTETLPQRTQYLFLQGNNISTLSSSALSNVTGLRWLILDHNHLKTLDSDLLQDQSELWYLFVNHNWLKSIPAGLPRGLRQLRLAHNRISSIGQEALSKLHKITVLLLQGNRLKTVAEGEVKGLLSLNLLDLSGNLLTSVPKDLPASVEQLYLSNNSLSSLERDSFSGYSSLKYLRLGHCGLNSPRIHHAAFNISSLIELDLSYNKLVTTPTVPTSLQYLYLEANRIQEFNLTSFCREGGPMSYSRIQVLRLEGNGLASHQLPPDWVYCLRVLHRLYI